MEGDLNSGSEQVVVTTDGVGGGTLCTGGSGCGQCAQTYQDTTSFDVTAQASDNSLAAVADGTSAVGASCDWPPDEDYSSKTEFKLSWQENPTPSSKSTLRKGITQATGWPLEYIVSSEDLFGISDNIVNDVRSKPIFTYYDESNTELITVADRLANTARIHIELIVNVNPNKQPGDFSLESDVHIRNLKTNL